MRHARPDDLEAIEPPLTQLRACDGLVERTPGSFYAYGLFCITEARYRKAA